MNQLFNVATWLESGYRANGVFPLRVISAGDYSEHSWRVASALFWDPGIAKGYSFDLPWHSEHNSKDYYGQIFVSIPSRNMNQFAGVFAVEENWKFLVDIQSVPVGTRFPVAFCCWEQTTIKWNEPSDDVRRDCLRVGDFCLFATRLDEEREGLPVEFGIESIEADELLLLIGTDNVVQVVDSVEYN